MYNSVVIIIDEDIIKLELFIKLKVILSHFNYQITKLR